MGEHNAYISMEGAGGVATKVPIMNYRVRANRDLNKLTGVASHVNTVLIDFEIANAGKMGSTFLMWFATDWANLKGEIGFPGQAEWKYVPGGESGYIAGPNVKLYGFDNAKVHSYEEYYGEKNVGEAFEKKTYSLKIGISCDVLSFYDVTLDRDEMRKTR